MKESQLPDVRLNVPMPPVKPPLRMLFELELDDGRCFRLEEKGGKYISFIVQEFDTIKDAVLPMFAEMDEKSIAGFMEQVTDAVSRTS